MPGARSSSPAAARGWVVSTPSRPSLHGASVVRQRHRRPAADAVAGEISDCRRPRRGAQRRRRRLDRRRSTHRHVRRRLRQDRLPRQQRRCPPHLSTRGSTPRPTFVAPSTPTCSAPSFPVPTPSRACRRKASASSSTSPREWPDRPSRGGRVLRDQGCGRHAYVQLGARPADARSTRQRHRPDRRHAHVGDHPRAPSDHGRVATCVGGRAGDLPA